MRDLFPGYFRPTEDEFDEMWGTATIVPDANILLHTLRYDEQTRKEVLDTLRALKAQVWVPYRVAHEFLRNWRDVDADNRTVHATVQKAVGEAGASLLAAFDAASRHRTIDAKAERQKITEFLDGLKKSLTEAQEKHPDKASAEESVQEIADLLGDAVGAKPSPEVIEQWAADGKKRFEAKVPPGYMDSKKDGIEKYGDWFIWKEILDRGAEKKLPTILICDDRKEDWAQIVKGERVGPRPELVEEYRSVTGAGFYSYTLDAFLRQAKKYVKSEVSDSTIQAIRQDQAHRAAAAAAVEAAVKANLKRVYIDSLRAEPSYPPAYIDELRRVLTNDELHRRGIRPKLLLKKRKPLGLTDMEAEELRYLVKLDRDLWASGDGRPANEFEAEVVPPDDSAQAPTDDSEE